MGIEARQAAVRVCQRQLCNVLLPFVAPEPLSGGETEWQPIGTVWVSASFVGCPPFLTAVGDRYRRWAVTFRTSTGDRSWPNWARYNVTSHAYPTSALSAPWHCP